MRKFIHSDFEIDLSSLKITDTSENPWFSGEYFAKYSYPFNIPLTDDMDKILGFISHNNSSGTKTYFEGIYVHGNQVEEAVLEVEELTIDLSVTLRYGLEDFPSFSKKLSELTLINLPVNDIYLHAAEVILKQWPEVGYNFPQIHIDKIDPDDDVWSSFQKIINNYKNGEFLRNTVDVVEEITYNRNIIQPLPYLLYLLQAGFQEAGYELKGDVLNDADLKKTLVYGDVTYYTNISQESIPILIMAEDYDTFVDDGKPYQHITLKKDYPILHPGKYRLEGSIRLRRRSGGTWTYIRIFYRNTILFNWPVEFSLHTFIDYNISIVFDTLIDFNPDFIRIEYDAGYAQDDILFDLSVNPIVLFNSAGSVTASIVNENRVELKKAVPDILFGDLVKFVLTAKLMSLDIRGKEIWMNFVTTEIRDKPIVDFSSKTVKYPKRIFNKGASWLFMYQDVNSEDYKYDKIFQNASGISSINYTTDEKTKEIILNAIPLPLLFRNDVQTAHAFISDITKLALVTYSGMQAGLNLSTSSANLLIPYLHEKYYQEWLADRINEETYTWSFLAHFEELIELTNKSRVHAYNNIHLINSIQKNEISPDLFDVELTTKLLK